MTKSDKSLLDGVYPIINFELKLVDTGYLTWTERTENAMNVTFWRMNIMLFLSVRRSISSVLLINDCLRSINRIQKNTFLDPDLMDMYEVADFLGEIDKVLEKR